MRIKRRMECIMKTTKKLVITLLFVFLLSLTTACSGCGSDNKRNPNDMVETTPSTIEESVVEEIVTSEAIVSDNTIDYQSGNSQNTTIADDMNGVVDDAGNTIGNAIDEAGNVVSDEVDGVGNAAKDAADAMRRK